MRLRARALMLICMSTWACKSRNSGTKVSAIEDTRRPETLQQNWTVGESRAFWHLPQGSYIIPYAWFEELRTADNRPLREAILAYGYIDGGGELPIGFTKDVPVPGFDELERNGPWLGVTCAACHVGKLSYKGREVIIDGAPSMGDFQGILLTIEERLRTALTNPEALEAFMGRLALKGLSLDRQEATNVLATLASRNERTFVHKPALSSPSQGNAPLAPVYADAGPGRTDAFGVILNEVTATDLGVPKNARINIAPVSYPFIWGAPKLERVQWNGLSNNAFNRNIGEVLGVFGRVRLDPKSADFLASTVNYASLLELEKLVVKLKPPRYEDAFGDADLAPIEYDLVDQGREIFLKNCNSCHALKPEIVKSDFGAEFYKVELIGLNDVKTDPQFYRNLANRTGIDAGPLANSQIFLAGQKPVLPRLTFGIDKSVPNEVKEKIVQDLKAKVTKGLQSIPPIPATYDAIPLLAQTTAALSYKYFADNGIAVGSDKYLEATGGANLAPPKEQAIAFKARSLEGIWATAPYLHNGSVRTLQQLLTKPEEREEKFYLGSYEFDAEGVGIASKGPYLFDTTKPGNGKGGHEYGTNLENAEKRELIEFLKTL